MKTIPIILADDTDSLVKFGVFIVVLVIWGIGALSKMVKGASDQQREKLRAVRESIERARREQMMQQGQIPQRTAKPPPRPRVALAPGIAMRLPQQRPARVPIPRKQPSRPATNYNAMARQPAPVRQSPVPPAPPPLPPGVNRPTEEVMVLTEVAEAPRAVAHRPKPVAVGAFAIRRWLRPDTLRQQFILTELFQPPIALRQPREQ